ncbi:Region-like protein isoform 1 [Dorcoceras hygrometricum]|uniref:Region-like protein isoform 1 n=1 Tax=Dorcoceras hygrometricum TaxID=472368 RepID=A0A2Z7APR5_9LAMI|nr:Region-like protein isoform 1 [Dorcoceras hygrometricum]
MSGISPDSGRTAAAAANIACGAWPHAAAPSAASSSAIVRLRMAHRRDQHATSCARAAGQRRPSRGKRTVQRPTFWLRCATRRTCCRAHMCRRGRGTAACGGGRQAEKNFVVQSEIREVDAIQATIVLKDPSQALVPLLGTVADPDPVSWRGSGRIKIRPGNAAVDSSIRSMTGRETPSSACTRRPDEISADGFTSKRLAGTNSGEGGGGGGRITDSACKNQLVVVSVQYGRFNPYIPIRSTTIGKSRVVRDPIAMHTSWRSNSEIASLTSIGYPRMSASGESSTTMHRLLHASGSHPIPPPNDPKWVEKLVARAVDRYDDVGVMYSLLLVVICAVLVAADQQARLCKSVKKRRRLIEWKRCVLSFLFERSAVGSNVYVTKVMSFGLVDTSSFGVISRDQQIDCFRESCYQLLVICLRELLSAGICYGVVLIS